MKKTLIKIAVCIVVFFVTIFISMNVLNQTNLDMTAEMTKATFPLVHIENSGIGYNTLHGLKQKIDVTFARDHITPLEENRRLSFVVEKYDNEILDMSFEVRSMDGTRLIEQTKITNYKEMDNLISASVTIKDLIDKNQEYNWILMLTTPETTISYYTRIIDMDHSALYDKLSFTKMFHEATFDKDAVKELAKYMESNSKGDNTTLNYVDIHCSLNQLSWADLAVKQITDTDVVVKEIDDKGAIILQNYIVETKNEKTKYHYRISEYYRIRTSKDRVYLLDFERTMNQIFDPRSNVYASNKIMLGIRDEQVQMVESEGGNNLAFVNEGQLLCYHAADKKMASIFSFFDGVDPRTTYDAHNIKIFHVDETGNVSFMVYGYMNRGIHEGELGIQVYEYNGMLNYIEERMFIPYDKTFATLQSDLNELAYMNKSEILYLYLDGAIVAVDLGAGSYQCIAEGLQAGTFQVSANNEMLVWQNAEQAIQCTKLNLMNLNTAVQKEITTTSQNRIKPLGFINNDLIYGIAHASDITEDISGVTTFPMYVLYIQNEQGDILKSYEQTGIYIKDCDIEDNLIALQRIKKEDGEYVETTNDQIVNNVIEESGANSIEVVATQNYEKIVQIVLKGEIESKNLKISEPKEILYEGTKNLDLAIENSVEKYYVYGKRDILGTFSDAADAINLALSQNGVVVDESGRYIWKSAAKSTRNQIMKITGMRKDAETSSLAVCLEALMNYYGYSVTAQHLLDQSETATEILTLHLLDQKVVELDNVELEAVLYYLNLDIPVIAVLDHDQAILLTGFNETHLVVMQPESGELVKISMNEAKNKLKESGNQFIVSIPYKD